MAACLPRVRSAPRVHSRSVNTSAFRRSEFNTYAGYTRPDNTIITPSGTALASFLGADNTGPPPTSHAVKKIFKKVRSIFPNAKVFSSTWDAFVADIAPEEIAALPRYSSEWADDWLTGISSDPARLATYRAIARARAACIGADACDARDPVLRNCTRFAAKNAEHTQGIQGAGGQVARDDASCKDVVS